MAIGHDCNVGHDGNVGREWTVCSPRALVVHGGCTRFVHLEVPLRLWTLVEANVSRGGNRRTQITGLTSVAMLPPAAVGTRPFMRWNRFKWDRLEEEERGGAGRRAHGAGRMRGAGLPRSGRINPFFPPTVPQREMWMHVQSATTLTLRRMIYNIDVYF